MSPPYLAGSFASDGRGTLCLLAGREQAGAPAVVSPGITAGPSGGKKGRGQAQGGGCVAQAPKIRVTRLLSPAQRGIITSV